MIKIARNRLAGVLTLLSLIALSQFSAYADHIHHLYYNNSTWQDQDLTVLSNGGVATPYGAIAAFRTTPNNQLHVYYVDTSNHVHQLYYNNTSWSDQDLTSFTGGPQASPYGLAGFATGNLQHVFYPGFDNHIHQLYYNNLGWVDQDITALANGPNIFSSTPMTAFITTPNDQFHVYYQAASENLDLHQLYFNGTSWVDNDLSTISGGYYCYTSWLSGFSAGNQQEVFCPGTVGNGEELDMIHIYYNNYSWYGEDITDITLGLPIHLGSGVASFLAPGQQKAQLFGVTGDFHIHDYYYLFKEWYDNDLTAFQGAPEDDVYGGFTAFVTPGPQYHFYYAPSNEVYQLYFDGTKWHVDDLTNGVGQADAFSGMAGFPIGNLQHVFYMTTQ